MRTRLSCLVVSGLLLGLLGCKKPAAVASDAAAPSSSASAALAPAGPPRCDPAACTDKCTCGQTGACTGGRCVRDPAWKVEELAMGGSTFACARYTNGRVQCAGANVAGQLGRGTRAVTESRSPASVTGLADVTRIVTGVQHACALAKDGRVWCWGSGSNGEVGAGAFDVIPTPQVVTGLTDVIALAAGDTHNCAIKRGGSVWCWGFNDKGQLGDGTKVNHNTPVEVKGVVGATQLALALHHSCAIAKDAAVVCWGQRGGANGIAAPLPAVPKSEQIGASQDEFCVSVTGGKVSCYGPSMTPKLVVVPGFAEATQIAGSNGLLCALRKSGTVTCGDWWAAADGKVTDVATDVRLLAVGGDWECVVGKDDHIACNAALPTKSVFEQL